MSSGEPLALEGLEALRDACARLLAQARFRLLLLSRNLDPRIYDQEPVLSALRQLALRTEHSRIRILLLDNRLLVRQPHRIVELTQRLSSRFEIRRPSGECAERSEEFLVVDDQGYLYREQAATYQALANADAPLEARRLRERFTEAWDRAQPDPELRRLHL